MYKKVNITENLLRILSLFARGFSKDFYIREIVSLLDLSPRTVKLSLDLLESKGVLVSKTRGKIRLFRLNNSPLTKQYLILAEQYSYLSFIEEHSFIKTILDSLLPHINGIALLFGSYVKGLAHENSDIDVFVIGSYDSERVDFLSQKYGVEINVKSYPLDVFRKVYSKDVLIREVLNNHFVLTGTSRFIEEVFAHE